MNSHFSDMVLRFGNVYASNIKILSDTLGSDFLQQKIFSAGLSIDQYLQGIAEAVWSCFFKTKGFDVSNDVKVNSKNKKDVDIVATRDGTTYNIEVKTPEQIVREPNSFYGTVGGYRIGTKEEYSATFTETKETLQDIFSKAGKGMQELKIDDNKLKDYLTGANEKFSETGDSELNILVVCLNTSDFLRYLPYLLNPFSGILSEKSFLDKDKWIKIDCIVFSNCIEGQVGNKNVVEADNFFNFIIPNRYKVPNLKPSVDGRLVGLVNKNIDLLLEILGNDYMNYIDYLRGVAIGIGDKLPQDHISKAFFDAGIECGKELKNRKIECNMLVYEGFAIRSFLDKYIKY